VKLLVLESGPSEAWKHEDRDIAADYSTLFGGVLERDVVAVAFMTDADSTDSAASAYYRDVKIGYLGATGKIGTRGAVASATDLFKGLIKKTGPPDIDAGEKSPDADGGGEDPKGKEQPSDI
jgi:hypothetical protein